MNERLPRLATCGLVVFGLLLWVNQHHTMLKFKGLGANSYNSPSLFWDDVRQFVVLETSDWVLIVGLVLLGVALLALEAWRAQLSALAIYVARSDCRALLFLTVFSFVAVRYYFSPGMNWGGDASAHLAYAHIATRSLAMGEWPFWTNYLGCGTPYLQFYGFLFFWVVAAFDVLCRDFYWAVKGVLALAHLLSGLGMYCFVRQICRARMAGLVAALAYILCFWHVQQVLVMGRYPLSLFYALLPWVFYGTERILHQPRSSCVLWTGIGFGLLAWVHPGYGFWGTCFLLLYAGIRLGQLRHLRSRLPALMALFALGLVVGSVQTLPMWWEQELTVLRDGMDLTGVPDPNWRHLLHWSNYMLRAIPLPLDCAHWYGGYMGVSVLGLAMLSLFYILRWQRWRSPVAALLAGLVVASVLVFAYRWAPLQMLLPVRAMNAARYLLFFAFFAAALAGAAAHMLSTLGRRSRRWASLAGILICVDLLPTTFLDMYAKGQLTRYEVLDELAALADEYAPLAPPGRTMVILGNTHPYLAFSWTYFTTGMPLAQADPGNLLPASSIFSNAFGLFLDRALGKLATDLDEEIKSSQVLWAGMRLLNVRHVLSLQENVGWLTLGDQSPVLVASRVEGYEGDLRQVFDEEQIERLLGKSISLSKLKILEQVYSIIGLIEKIQVSPFENRAERFLLANYEGTHDLGGDPSIEVLAHRVYNQRVELNVRLAQKAYARLAYAYYPHLRVEVDGVRIPALSTAGGFICLMMEAGEHEIVLVPELSPLRRILWGVCALIFAAALWASWQSRQHALSQI